MTRPDKAKLSTTQDAFNVNIRALGFLDAAR